jgi:hypothetical protein
VVFAVSGAERRVSMEREHPGRSLPELKEDRLIGQGKQDQRVRRLIEWTGPDLELPNSQEVETPMITSRQESQARYIEFRRTYPETEVWIRAGLIPRAAKALVEAGIRTPEDLRKCCREDVLALRGLGLEQLRKCEQILGQQLPTRRADYWTANGVHCKAAKALISAGLHSIEDMEGMTREQLLFLPCVGEVAIRHLERLRGGRPLPSYEDYWRNQGFDPKSAIRLSRAGICNLDELRKKSPAELRRITQQEIEAWLG